MSVKKLVLVGFSAAMLLAPGAAFAAANVSSPPEPYTAPDPVYPTPHVKSDVTMKQPKDHVSLTDNGASTGTAMHN